MKKAILLLFLFPFLLQAQKDTRMKIWDILASTNPDAHNMMKELYALPSQFKLGSSTMTVSKPADFMVYIDEATDESILSSISTAVHESCHMYQSQKAYQIIDEQNLPFSFGSQFNVYYISSDMEILVQETQVFPSLQIARLVPKELRKSRFNTYINSRNKILGTQQSGIYGLMDEWSAYLNGFKTTVLNYPIYQENAQANPGYFLNYISDASSTKLSHYEFKYFILLYLSYAKNKEKKTYKEIISNTEMKRAYLAIDQAFQRIILMYDDKVGSIEKFVNESGGRFERTKDFIWIGNRGVGTYEDEILEFKKALASPEFEPILADLNK